MKGAGNRNELFLVPGINPVVELLRSKKGEIAEIWVMRGTYSNRIKEIVEAACGRGIIVQEKDRLDFSPYSHLTHQGVVAFIKGSLYISLQELLKKIDLKEDPVLVAADHITDEGNLGSIIRSASYLGASGVILSKDRSARLTPNVFKRSSGALMHLDVAMVTNLHMALRELKQRGFWIIGTSAKEGIKVSEFDLVRPTVLVMGSESKGISPVLKKILDATLKIPGTGPLDSLNVSVATGIILYEIHRQKTSREMT